MSNALAQEADPLFVLFDDLLKRAFSDCKRVLFDDIERATMSSTVFNKGINSRKNATLMELRNYA